MDYAKESLKLHAKWRGKIEVHSKVKVETKEDLSLAYTPGVAEPCLAIKNDYNKSFELTMRSNSVAVITDGTAVLGLGDIGPEAGMPVMEGKCVLFKAFGGVDAIPLCVRSKNVDEIVQTINIGIFLRESLRVSIVGAELFVSVENDILVVKQVINANIEQYGIAFH